MRPLPLLLCLQHPRQPARGAPCAGGARGELRKGLRGGRRGRKGKGEGDNDKRGSCGSFNIFKEIETEIYKN